MRGWFEYERRLMSPPLVPWRAQIVIFAVVALIASALSVAAFGAELATFTASGRDLGFFMAQYERLLDVPVWRGLAVQPSGNDAFGFSGLDGAPTLHADIHLSPLKYVLACVHTTTGSWPAVQIALTAIVLAGLAYALVRLQRAWPGNTLALAALTVVAVSPLFIGGACHDLRPSVALAPFVAALTAALLTRAPSSHVTILALLGLLVREEASVIVALASLWLALEGRRDDAWHTFAIAVSYFAGFHVLYFAFLPFTYAPHPGTALVWLAFVAPLAFLRAPSAWTEHLCRAHERHRASTVSMLGAPFAVALVDPYFGGHLIRDALARTFPATLAVLLAAVHAMLAHTSVRAQQRVAMLLAIGVVPALALSLGVIDAQRAEAPEGRDVWALVERLPEGTPIVTDFLHYQAFAGRDRLLVWERLPVALETPLGPEAPEQRPALLRALRDTDALWVMSGASYRTLTAADVGPIERCAGPTEFVVAHRRGGRVPCPR